MQYSCETTISTSNGFGVSLHRPYDAKVGAVTARPRFVLFWTQLGTCFVGETLGTDVGGTKAVANIKHHKSMEGVFK